jgi:outer membrane protein assembly factor BamE (lipoprotein component of BamABCDE complex)
MKLNHLGVGFRSALLVAALCSAALVQAASGFIVTTAQQNAVQVGMSRAEVRALLGRPAHNVKYRDEPGRTWTYGINAHANAGAEMVFDVDFSADGRVLSKSLRVELMN